MNYEVQIKVLPDETLQVIEQIKLRAKGEKIRKGIIRSFPPDFYRTDSNKRFPLTISDIRVTRNNRTENFSTKYDSTTQRTLLVIGNDLIDSGVHQYQIQYRTNAVIQNKDGMKVLVFEPLGYGWVAPVDQLLVRVDLPSATKAQQIGGRLYQIDENNEVPDVPGVDVDYGGSWITLKADDIPKPIRGVVMAVNWR